MRILAFDIGGTEIKYALCDESFNLSDKKSVPSNAEEGGLGAALCRPAVKAAAIKDKNLAKAAQEAVSGNEMWKLYSGGEI